MRWPFEKVAAFYLPLACHFLTNNPSGLCDKMASATLKDLAKAPTLSPPVHSHALPEHSRNIKDIRDKCVLAGYCIEYFSKDPMICRKRYSFVVSTYAMAGF